MIKCLSKESFESYLRSKHSTLNTSHSFPISKSLHNHVKSSRQRYQLTLVGKAKSKLSLNKNEELKNVLLKIHVLSSREFQKSIGLRNFGVLTMHNLGMVT